MNSSRKQLIVNADDFGFTPDVNEGIVEAHQRGILTATTLMANGAAFDHAVKLACAVPTLDIGCHLVLIGGNSLVTGAPLPRTVGELLRALTARRIRAYDELRAQVVRIQEAGIRPTHLDTHKHTHFAPPVLEAVASLGAEFGIRWIRSPFDIPLDAAEGAVSAAKRLANRSLGLLRGHFRRVLARHQCRSTDHFAGFQITGHLHPRELAALIRKLPEGTTELMCHPGRCGDALRQAPTRLKESREEELAALTSPEIREAITRSGVMLVNYQQLTSG